MHSRRRWVGKATNAVPTNRAAGMDVLRFASPDGDDEASYFFTSGQREASSDWNASLPGIVVSSL